MPADLLKLRLADYLERRFGLVRRRKVTGRVLDRAYRVAAGSVRERADYDDAWLLALASEARVVFDLGCNVGGASLLVLYWPQVERVFLVDPNPAALAVAAENLIANHLSARATFLPAFVSDAVGESVRFYTVGAGAAGSMYASHAKSAAAMGSSMEVPTLTVDWMAERYGVHPDLVKVDVEGAEGLVLKGAVETARRGTRFMVEMHGTAEVPMRENGAQVLAWCASHGYRAWFLAAKAELTDPAQLGARGRLHLLLHPRDTPVPAYLQEIDEKAPLERVREVLGRAAPAAG
jgi:FkbM family methyltransferase